MYPIKTRTTYMSNIDMHYILIYLIQTRTVYYCIQYKHAAYTNTSNIDTHYILIYLIQARTIYYYI